MPLAFPSEPALTPARTALARALRALSLAGALALAASCSGGDITAPVATGPGATVPGGPELPPVGPNGEVLVTCQADVRAGVVTCGNLAAGPTVAAARDIIVGGQNVYVTLTGGAVVTTTGHRCDGTADATAQCFAFPVTVKNLIPQPMGTTDGTTAAPNGVAVFFADGPTTTGGSGTIAAANAQGPSVFLSSGALYFKYAGALLGADGILSTGETSGGTSWRFEAGSGVTSFTFKVYVSAPVPHQYGYVDLSLTNGGAAVTTASVARGGTSPLFATPRDAVGRALTGADLSGGVTYASANTAVATVDPTTGVVSGVGNGTTTITASVTRSTGQTITGVVAVTVTSTAPVGHDDAYAVQMGVPLVTTNHGVLANDTDADDPVTSLTVSKVTDPAHGTVALNADGTFTYTPAAGFTGGTDSFTYRVSDGSSTSAAATVTFTVSGRTWWVDGSSSGTHDGGKATPFVSLATAEGSAIAGDTIFVVGGGSATGAALKASQVLIGQGVASAVTRHLTATPASQASDVTLVAAGSATPVNASLLVSTNNTLRGLDVTVASGTAIGGASFGTLTVSESNANAQSGAALNLSAGTLAASFGTLSATGSSTTDISLQNVNGTLTATGGTLSGATTTTVDITGGGAVSVAYAGSMTKSNAGALVSVAGGHTGTLTFSGSLSASSGTGLQFDNADGTYQFTGTTMLSGGDAGIDVTNGSSGTFTFGAGTTITNPTNEVIKLAGSAPVFTYSGAFSKSSTGTGLDFSTLAGGSVALNGTGVTRSLSTSTSTGILISGNSATTVIAFSGDPISITTTTGAGFSATGPGNLSVTGAGHTISSGIGAPLTITSQAISASGVTFRSVSGTSGTAGISLGSLTGSGNVTITGTSGAGSGGTISNASGTAVALSALGSYTGTVSLSNMNLSNAAGTVLSGTTFGTLQLTGDALTATGGPALALTTGGLYSGSTLTSVNASGAANPISFSSVTGGLTIGGGTITGGTGAVWTVSGGSVDVNSSASMSQANASPLVSVSGGHTGTLTFGTGTLDATNGSGLQFDNADGTYNFNGTTTLHGGDAGVDVLNGSSGSFFFGTGVAITSPTGIAFAVSTSTPSVNFTGSIVQANNAAAVDVTTQASGTIGFTGAVSATNGPGINLNNADGTVSFTGSTTLNGGNAHVDVNTGSAGTLNLSNASVTSPTAAAALRLNASAESVNWTAGTITVLANSQRPVDIQSNTGGTVNIGAAIRTNQLGILVNANTGGSYTFSGSSQRIATGVNPGVSLTSNTGATIAFTGGTLADTTTTASAFTATGGGTVTVTGGANTLVSTTGTALNVTSTTLGAANLTFRSIDANGGANGIFVQTTGSAGRLIVTGNGGRCDTGLQTCSGGTIQGMVGGDGATAGNGVYVESTLNPTLSLMRIRNVQNNGIYGTGTKGLTLTQMLFDGTNGTSNSGTYNESDVQLQNVSGGIKLDSSVFNGAAMNAVRIDNHAGTAPVIDSLVLAGDTVTTMQGSQSDVRGTALLVTLMDGAGNNIRMRNNYVTTWWGNAIHVLAQGTSSATASITNNFADNTNGALAGAGGIWVAGGTLTYKIDGNTVRNTNGTAISADRVNAGTLMQGTISNNLIGVSGVSNSGSGTGIGIFASHHGPQTSIVKISGNTLRQINGSASGAITTLIGDAAGFGGNGTIQATISGNNIAESGTTVNSAQQGILMTHNTNSTAPDAGIGCYDVLSNSITNFNSGSASTAQNRIRINERFGGYMQFPGFSGPNTSAGITAYLLGRNTASNAIATTNLGSTQGGGGFVNTSACTQPATVP